MKLVQIIVAASIFFPTMSSFAQSTPLAVNEDVRSQQVQEEAMYRSLDSSDKKQASLNRVDRNRVQNRQIAGANLGRYSLSVAGPSY
jgi:ABC-type Mn2+/Zn2+ transport system ATPase subunit